MDLRDFTWILSAAGIAAVYLLWHTNKNRKSSIEILDMEYDKNSRRIELTVENTNVRPKNIQFALRLINYKKPELEFVSEGVPMMAGRAQSNNVAGFDLLAEDDHPTLIRGSSTEKFFYVIPDALTLKPDDSIRVDIRSEGGHVSTIVPLKFREGMADMARRVDVDINDLIGRIDEKIVEVERKSLSEADEITRFKLMWEEEILKDIEREIMSEKEKIEESMKHLIGFTYGPGLSLEEAS